MTIPALGVGTGQAVQDCGLSMFKIGKAQDGLGFLAIDSGARFLLHGLWPPVAVGLLDERQLKRELATMHPPGFLDEVCFCYRSDVQLASTIPGCYKGTFHVQSM
jgi:hypothetical protein